MEDLDTTFVGRVQKGDIMVAGSNFGCGSSREHAPIAIKASGISCVIAQTFARIFYRNAINIGLPRSLKARRRLQISPRGDMLEIDFDYRSDQQPDKRVSYKGVPFPEFMQKIITADGLIGYIGQK